MRHKSVGIGLNPNEWEGVDTHQFDLQAAGDMIIVNAGRVMVRVPVGTEGQVLEIVSGIPAWRTE